MENAKRPRVEVRRAGGETEVLDAEQFDTLQADGGLSPTDLCREEGETAWMALDAFLKRRAAQAFRTALRSDEATPPPAAAPDSASGREQSSNVPVAGLIFLIGLLVLASGLGSWGYLQWLEAREWKSRAEDLRDEVEKLRATAPRTTPEPDLVPRGMIRGRVILRNAQGRRTTFPGVQVKLYDRSSLEQFLGAAIPAILQSDAGDPLALLLARLPAPLSATRTDASGVYVFEPPGPGDYVVQTSVLDKSTRKLRTWFLAVDTRDALNTPVDFTDSNAVSVLVPMLMPREAR